MKNLLFLITLFIFIGCAKNKECGCECNDQGCICICRNDCKCSENADCKKICHNCMK